MPAGGSADPQMGEKLLVELDPETRPARGGETATTTQIRLENREATLDGERAERTDAGVGLAGGETHRNLRGEAGVTRDVVGLKRLLEPVQLRLVDAPQ